MIFGKSQYNTQYNYTGLRILLLVKAEAISEAGVPIVSGDAVILSHASLAQGAISTPEIYRDYTIYLDNAALANANILSPEIIPQQISKIISLRIRHNNEIVRMTKYVAQISSNKLRVRPNTSSEPVIVETHLINGLDNATKWRIIAVRETGQQTIATVAERRVVPL